MMINSLNKKKQSGNILFLILIAVALFAALSYAVTQSSRSGGDASREANILNAAQIAQYPNLIRTAILRQTIDGIDPTAVRFNIPANFTDLDSNRIGVFHPEGGGAVHQLAPADMMADGNDGTWVYNMEFEVTDIGLSTGSSAAGNDIIAFLPGVSLAVCQRINVEANVRANISDAPPVTADINGGLAGDYDFDMVDDGTTDYPSPTTETDLDGTGGDAGTLHGRPFGCFDNASEEYVYYHVINER